MRRIVWTTVFSAVVLLAGVPPALAQFMRDHEAEGGVRGFHGLRSGKITRSFQSDAEADAEFKRILSAVGLGYVSDRISLRATAQTPNAEAFIDEKTGERFIFYNAQFMQKVKQRTADDWSPVSILAHELGHHLAFHTAIAGNDHKFELEADYFSGFVLRRLGATLAQSDAAMRVISPKEPGPSHPGLDDRLQAITIGWTDGGAQGGPRGLKKVDEVAAKPAAPPPVISPPQLAASEVAAAWALVKDSADLHSVDAFRKQYGGGNPFYDRLAETRIEELKQAAEARERERVSLLQKQQEEEKRRAEKKRDAEVDASRPDPALSVRPGSGETFRNRLADGQPCPECPEMVVVPAGSFTMGSPPGEKGRSDHEGPQRSVMIEKPFAVGKFEVTFDEWDACVADGGCKYNPGDDGWGRGRRPVINVSWDDIKEEYLPWLSRKTGKSYRLLSEAEWEYAARAGTITRYASGDAISRSQARYLSDKTVTVGSFQPNKFGLYDMHGNVSEWVQDCWNGNYDGAPSDGSARTTGNCDLPVMRGGSFAGGPTDLRSAFRYWNIPISRSGHLGFRVGRTL